MSSWENDVYLLVANSTRVAHITQVEALQAPERQSEVL